MVVKAIEFPHSENGQDVLLADSLWLEDRLRTLGADLVIGTLAERHALPCDDDEYRRMAYSDIWLAFLAAGTEMSNVGPLLKFRRQVAEDAHGDQRPTPLDEEVPDEPFDATDV